jgi:hypothetical protein
MVMVPRTNEISPAFWRVLAAMETVGRLTPSICAIKLWVIGKVAP